MVKVNAKKGQLRARSSKKTIYDLQTKSEITRLSQKLQGVQDMIKHWSLIETYMNTVKYIKYVSS